VHLTLFPPLHCPLLLLVGSGSGTLLTREEEVIADVVAQEHEEGGDDHWQDRERGPYQVHLHF